MPLIWSIRMSPVTANNGIIPANIYLFKFNKRNTGKRCEICSKLTTKTPRRRHWRPSGVFIINFEHNSLSFVVFLLPTLLFKNSILGWDVLQR